MDTDIEIVNSNIEKIISLKPSVNRLVKCFSPDMDESYVIENETEAAKHWKANTYHHALIRMEQLIEDNFKVIETLALVSASRYIFELSLWLNLFEVDVKYALVYHRRLIDGGKRYYEDTLNQHIREVELLRSFEEMDVKKRNEASDEVKETSGVTVDQAAGIFLRARNETDAKAARLFSIYSDQAKSNGYGTQAAIIEANVIPTLHDGVQAHEERLNKFDGKYGNATKELIGCSKYDKMAIEVGLKDEYDYIYSFTSKLLHCSPSSVSTNQKKLENYEAAIFLRYIHTKLRDIIDLALEQPACEIRSI